MILGSGTEHLLAFVRVVFNDLCNLQWHPKPRNGSISHLLLCNCFVYQNLSDGYDAECFHGRCYKARPGRAFCVKLITAQVGLMVPNGALGIGSVHFHLEKETVPFPECTGKASALVHRCLLLPTPNKPGCHCGVVCHSSGEKLLTGAVT